MNGYTRIRKVSTGRSKSIDYSDVSSVPKPTLSDPVGNHISELPHDNKENQKKNTADIQEPIQESETGGEIFGVILSRKCSVSSNCSNIFLSEKQNSSSSLSVNSALKRTLSSIKRSSSVSDGYSRIHHQSDPPADVDDDDHILMLNTVQTRSMTKKGKFFRACKRMLGF